jgi:hypothetical protein
MMRSTRAGQMTTATIPSGRNNDRDGAATLIPSGAVVVISTSLASSELEGLTCGPVKTYRPSEDPAT